MRYSRLAVDGPRLMPATKGHVMDSISLTASQSISAISHSNGEQSFSITMELARFDNLRLPGTRPLNPRNNMPLAPKFKRFDMAHRKQVNVFG